MKSMFSSIMTRFSGKLAAAVVTAAVASGGPALAQFEGFGDDRPEFSPRDLSRMTDMLRLDGGQRELVSHFLNEYQTGFNELSAAYEAKEEALRDELREGGAGRDNWRDLLEPVRALQTDRRRENRALRDEFITNVQSVLSPEQVERWPAWEREMRRRRDLPQGFLAGESVNLFDVVDESIPDPAERLKIQPLLEEYDLRLDEALERRAKDLADIENAFRDILRNADFDEAMKRAEDQRKLRTRIRDLHDDYANRIASELSNPQPFRIAFREKAYPDVYRDTYGETIFNTVLTMDLEPATADAVAVLSEQFFLRLNQINESLERTVRQYDPTSIERRIGMVQARMRGEQMDFEDPIRKAMQARSDYEEGMIKQLHAMLTPEQIESLPDAPRNRGGERGRGGGFDIRNVPGSGGGGGGGGGGGRGGGGGNRGGGRGG
ncbi:MAG: hypothetical protein ACR2GY_10160 [Phycisphaerales bacterium]